jgi:hypothetical protein
MDDYSVQPNRRSGSERLPPQLLIQRVEVEVDIFIGKVNDVVGIVTACVLCFTHQVSALPD